MPHICFMEILVSIQEYLNGNMPYNEAVLLYNRIGTSSAIKKLLESGEDDYSRDKLKAEFQKIVSNLQANKEENNFKSFTKSKNEGAVQVELLPANLREEYHKLRPIIGEIRNLHAKLPMYSTKEERFDTAKRIVELVAKRRIIWDRIDYFKEHGVDHPIYQAPVIVEAPAETATKITLFEAKHKLNLLRSQRTKLKNKIHRFEDYTRVCKEIDELNNLISNG